MEGKSARFFQEGELVLFRLQLERLMEKLKWRIARNESGPATPAEIVDVTNLQNWNFIKSLPIERQATRHMSSTFCRFLLNFKKNFPVRANFASSSGPTKRA